MDLSLVHQQISTVGHQLLLAGINLPFSGHISIRDEKSLYITSHSSNLGALQKDELVKIALTDETPNLQASVGRKVHQAIYRQIPEAKAIVHAHPAAAIALSFQLEEIIPLDMEGRFYLPEIPVVFITYDEYLDLAPQILPAALQKNRAIIVRGHGSFVWGTDLREAFHLTVILEQICRLIIHDTLLDRS